MIRKFIKLIMLSIIFSVLLTSCVNDKDKEVETQQTSATEKAETSEAISKQTTAIQTETAQQETLTQSANTSQAITTTEITEVTMQKVTTIKENEDVKLCEMPEVVIDETTPVIVKPEKPVITAEAQYDIDNNLININWNSRNPNGNFEVLASTDGINYQSVENVNNQNSYMLPLSGYYELIYIKVKQFVDIDVTAESNVVIIKNSSSLEKEGNLFNDEAFYVSVESDLESLNQINHSSTIKLLYSINCCLENVESYKVTCSYSNACLLSEKYNMFL